MADVVDELRDVPQKAEPRRDLTQRAADGELRLALAMNGGVSLAVWIGGVSEEILTMVRSSPTPGPRPRQDGYAALLDVLDLDVSVDVISGASAGGINGGLLAIGMVRRLEDIRAGRSVWISRGDLNELLRPALTADAPSLLDGQFFYEAMQAELGQIAATGVADPDNGPPVTLRLTASMLRGTTTEYPGAAGTKIVDTDFEGVFEFTHEDLETPEGIEALALAARATASFPFAFEPTWVPLADDDPTGRPNLARYLRPAPGPDSKGMWVVDGGALNNKPIDAALREVFAREADYSVRRALLYVIPDPGEDVTASPSAPRRQPEKADAPPSLVEVLFRAGFTMPRNQSVRQEIEAIERNNRSAVSYATLRWDLAGSLGDGLYDTACQFESAYRENQAVRSANDATAAVLGVLTGAGRITDFDERFTVAELKEALKTARLNHYPDPYLPPDGVRVSTWGELDRERPGAYSSDDRAGKPSYWGYGLTSAIRAISAPIDLGQDVLALSNAPQHGDGTGTSDAAQQRLDDQADAARATIRESLRATSDVLTQVLALETEPGWLRQHAQRLVTDVPKEETGELEPVSLPVWASEYFRTWNGSPQRKHEYFALVGAYVHDAMVEFVRIIDALDDIVEWAENRRDPGNKQVLLDESLERLKALAAATSGLDIGGGVTDGPPASGGSVADDSMVAMIAAVGEGGQREPVVDLAMLTAADADKVAQARASLRAEMLLRQLLAVELLFNATTAELRVPQQVDLAQVSAYATCHIGRETRDPAAKLTGVELGHFAAFYRRAWRANDYMWGRLDAAERLTTVGLDPQRLRQQFHRAERGVATEQLRLAASATTNPRLQQDLAAAWDTDAADLTKALGKELDAIENGESLASVPAVAAAIARRRQVEIAEQELPLIADELRADETEGVILSSAAQLFLNAVDKGWEDDGVRDLDTLVDAFTKCRVGEERLEGELRSDRFGKIAGQTVAVSTTTLQNSVPWKTGKSLLRGLRGIGIGGYFLTSLTSGDARGSGLAQFLTLALLAAGGVSYASVFLVGASGLGGSVVGAALMMVPIFFLARRFGWMALPMLLLVLLIPAAVWNLDALLDGWRPAGDALPPRFGRWVIDTAVERRVPFTIAAAAVCFTLLGRFRGRPRPQPKMAEVQK